jgi:hypothetical protein
VSDPHNQIQQQNLVRPERLELPTLCSEGRCSIRLSYGRAGFILRHGEGKGTLGNRLEFYCAWDQQPALSEDESPATARSLQIFKRQSLRD